MPSLSCLYLYVRKYYQCKFAMSEATLTDLKISLLFYDLCKLHQFITKVYTQSEKFITKTCTWLSHTPKLAQHSLGGPCTPFASHRHLKLVRLKQYPSCFVKSYQQYISTNWFISILNGKGISQNVTHLRHLCWSSTYVFSP